MQKSKELEQNIDNIKYDIETLEMEKIGLIRKFRFLKEKLVINFNSDFFIYNIYCRV